MDDALGEAPLPRVPLEPVAVLTRDDRLQREPGYRLDDGEVGAGRRRATSAVDRDRHVREAVHGARSAVVVEDDAVVVAPRASATPRMRSGRTDDPSSACSNNAATPSRSPASIRNAYSWISARISSMSPLSLMAHLASAHRHTCPPSTSIDSPLTNDAASEHNQTAASATFSAGRTRPSPSSSAWASPSRGSRR